MLSGPKDWGRIAILLMDGCVTVSAGRNLANDQIPSPKSQSKPNDQAPNPKPMPVFAALFWGLVIGIWDLIGLLLLNFFPTLQSFSSGCGQQLGSVGLAGSCQCGD